MKRFLLGICFLLLTTFQFMSWSTLEEKLFSPMDQRDWKIGFQEYAYDQTLIELVPQDQDILNWQDLFTVQKFEDLDLSAPEFAGNLEQAFKKHVTKDQKLVFDRVEPKYLQIFESSFVYKGDERPKESLIAFDEYNLGRVLKGKNAVYYIRYSTKDADTFQKNKAFWIDRLKLMYLASEPKPDQEGNWLTFSSEGVFQNGKKLIYDANSRILTHNKAQLILSLPNHWLAEEQDQKETDFDELYPYHLALVFSDPTTGIYGGAAYHSKTESANLKEELAKRYEKIYKEQLPNIKIIEKGTLHTVLGQESIFINLKEGNDLGWVAFFESPEKAYRIELWGPVDKSEKLKEDFYKLVTNFQMKN